MKRQRRSERDRKEDRLSDLPDCVLLHIMKFMNTKQAVQTCVLSKRWKDLWKRLTNLTLDSSYFNSLALFGKFVSGVMSCRDVSISLHSLDFSRHGCIEKKLLDRVMRYAVSHNVQQLIINVNLDFKKFPPCIFSCQSLAFLKLSFRSISGMTKLPKSLELPALESLHLVYVTFTTSDKGYAEPFSSCNNLKTLVIDHCTLQPDAKVLLISNHKLSRLTICRLKSSAYLATPNLRSVTIMGDPVHKLSACNLSFLEEVNIDVRCYKDFPKKGLVLISWLQVLANVKTMTLCSNTLKILDVLSTHGSMRTQPPCFHRLESLKVKMKSFSYISDEGVSRTLEYLLQNSPLPRVDIINS